MREKLIARHVARLVSWSQPVVVLGLRASASCRYIASLPPAPLNKSLPWQDFDPSDCLEGFVLMSVFKPDFGPKDLPRLPDIRSYEIHQRIFTHRSFAARPTHVFEDSPADPSPDNEVLEHLGDQVLGLVVTELIYDLFPHLRVGPSTLRQIFLIRPSSPARRAIPDLADRSNPDLADVFESYVGGLYQDQGLKAVQDWLRPLLRPYVREAYRIVRFQHGLPPLDATDQYYPPPSLASPPPSPPPTTAIVGHLGLFNQRLQQESKSVEWSFSDSKGEGTKATPLWIAKAIINNECWGKGRGNTKKAAKNEAAKEGLRKLGYEVES
ncbi:hypothetical protein EW146_g4225 [Bondarzewia mesenterica]|uniref:RNase III domain-containing protein n=1 Tax=Bondarzewia mesenterica TaxID=1095465 RepID=A0A4S4M100_9AGAM|nr:hypothetical protein EW146_g4225 [Bondarzewia mesenterica]